MKFTLLPMIFVILLSASVSAIQLCSFDDAINFCKQFKGDESSCTAIIPDSNFACTYLSDKTCIPTGWSQTNDDRCVCLIDSHQVLVNVGDACSRDLINNPYCGNGILDIAEACDIVGETGDAGFCQANSDGVSCVNCKCVTFCGDGIVQSLNDDGIAEECDGSEFSASLACSDYDSSFAEGKLKCSAECDIDASACLIYAPPEIPAQNILDVNKTDEESSDAVNSADEGGILPGTVCGDGVLEMDEECEIDGQCSSGQICESCSCINDTFGPIEEIIDFAVPATCGNFKLDAGEDCDGVPVKGSYDWICTPVEVCDSTCRCVSLDIACGNGVLDGGEQCDVSAIDGKVCLEGMICSGRCACIGLKTEAGELPEVVKQKPAAQELESKVSSLSQIDAPQAIRASSNGKLLFGGLALLVLGVIAFLAFIRHKHGVVKSVHVNENAAGQEPAQTPQPEALTLGGDAQ